MCKRCLADGATQRHPGRPRVLTETERTLAKRTSAADWARENPERLRFLQRRAYLLRQYGLSLEQYDEMLTRQDGRCAICPATPEDNGALLSVDHDHETGMIRGLLCKVCNRDMGRIDKHREGFLRYLGVAP